MCGVVCGKFYPATDVDPGFREGIGEEFMDEFLNFHCSQSCLDAAVEYAIENRTCICHEGPDSVALAKIKPVLSTDCRNKDHRFCEGEESALWPDGETTIRKCSCSCHPSPKATDAKSAAEQARDDALFALEALCEEVNAMKTGHTYTLVDCIQGAVDYRKYKSFPESGNEERNG
jgi:hypothetical protein